MTGLPEQREQEIREWIRVGLDLRGYLAALLAALDAERVARQQAEQEADRKLKAERQSMLDYWQGQYDRVVRERDEEKESLVNEGGDMTEPRLTFLLAEIDARAKQFVREHDDDNAWSEARIIARDAEFLCVTLKDVVVAATRLAQLLDLVKTPGTPDPPETSGY